MKKTEPITALRDTNKLEEDLRAADGRLPVSKNGTIRFVIVSPEEYEKLEEKKEDRPSSEEVTIDIAFSGNNLGFARVAGGTPFVHLGNPEGNADEIIKAIKEAAGNGAHVLALPELCLTGYTLGDGFLDERILQGVLDGIKKILDETKELNIIFAFGAPFKVLSRLYNCAFVCSKGKLLGIVPKTYIPTYSEFYEGRHFAVAPKKRLNVRLFGEEVPFGTGIVFVDRACPSLKIGVEICEDLWVPSSPSTELALAGATVILNLSSSNETVGKAAYRRSLVSMASAKEVAAYVYADSGEGESTSDLVFASHNIIAENGKILRESPLFSMKMAISDIDLDLLQAERRRMNSFKEEINDKTLYVTFDLPIRLPEVLNRSYDRNPFIPSGNVDTERVTSILDIQAAGLANRLRAIRCHKAVIGLSGGLDSTLALLVTHRAFVKLGLDPREITAITLPCFGTSKRTHDNAEALARSLGVTFREINIAESVKCHLKDIGHGDDLNVAYENAQARERTQVLMDIANDTGAIMIGTGDLSELCLGWCTYNGDHMSMYGVNASIPKTLVKYLVRGYAVLHPECAPSLLDILDTPISPELLPTDKEGKIAQKTEDKIGPYELHDFFIYYYLRYHFRPKKLYFIAKEAFRGEYDDATIKKWLTVFFKRFFANQFKRNCLPDGAKVGSAAISPRGDLRFPSDADGSLLIKESESL